MLRCYAGARSMPPQLPSLFRSCAAAVAAPCLRHQHRSLQAHASDSAANLQSSWHTAGCQHMHAQVGGDNHHAHPVPNVLTMPLRRSGRLSAAQFRVAARLPRRRCDDNLLNAHIRCCSRRGACSAACELHVCASAERCVPTIASGSGCKAYL